MDRATLPYGLLTVSLGAGLLAALAALATNARRARRRNVERTEGAPRWRTARGAISSNSAGRAPNGVGVGLDVTNLECVEKENRASVEQLERAILGSTAHAWEHVLLDGTMAGATSTYTNLWESLGYDARDADFATTNAALLHPEEAEHFTAAVQALLAGQEREWEREVRLRHKDGTDRWHLARGAVERDPVSGKALRYSGCGFDITGLKATERKLRESEEQLRATFENAAVGMAVSAGQGRFVECNLKLCDILGYSKDEMVGHAFVEFGIPDEVEGELDRHGAFLRGELATFSRDKQYVRKDGSRLWANLSASALRRDGDGKPTHVLAILQDISARKSLEQELQNTKDLLELGIRGSNLTIFDFDILDGDVARSRVHLINFWELFGYEPTGAPRDFGAVSARILTPEDQPLVHDAIAACLRGDVPRVEIEHRIRHQDGTLKWVLARGVVIRDENGAPIRLVGSHVDITERRRAEERLRESELRWRNLTEALPQLIWTAAADGTIEYLSEQACEYTGLTEQELLSDGWVNAVHPDELAQTAKSWIASVERRTPHEVEHRLRRWDGTYRWFTTRAEPARDAEGRILKWVGSSTDITALKQAETDLRRAKDLLELGVRGSKVGIFEFDIPDGVVDTTRQTTINVWETLGYDTEAVPEGSSPQTMLAIHPGDLARVQAEIHRYLRRERDDFEVEYRVLHKDGTILWRMARGTALWDPDGTPTRFLGSFFDITDNKRVEARLRESEQRWRNIAETLPQLVWTTDAEGKGDYFSTQCESFTGVAEADMFGDGWLKIVHPDDREHSTARWAEAVRTRSKATRASPRRRASTRWTSAFAALTAAIAGSRREPRRSATTPAACSSGSARARTS